MLFAKSDFVSSLKLETGGKKKGKNSKRRSFCDGPTDFGFFFLLDKLSLKVLNLADGAAQQHREDHAEELHNADADPRGENVGKVRVQQGFQLRSAALQNENLKTEFSKLV